MKQHIPIRQFMSDRMPLRHKYDPFYNVINHEWIVDFPTRDDVRKGLKKFDFSANLIETNDLGGLDESSK